MKGCSPEFVGGRCVVKSADCSLDLIRGALCLDIACKSLTPHGRQEMGKPLSRFPFCQPFWCTSFVPEQIYANTFVHIYIPHTYTSDDPRHSQWPSGPGLGPGPAAGGFGSCNIYVCGIYICTTIRCYLPALLCYYFTLFVGGILTLT